MRSQSAKDIYNNTKWIASEALAARRSLSLSSLIKRSDSMEKVVTTKPSPAMFLQLAQKGRFQDLAQILKSNDDKAIVEWLEDEKPAENPGPHASDQEGRPTPRLNILHQVMFHYPPVEVVDLLCTSLTRVKGISVPEDLINEQGLTPLHIAAAHGCDAAVIQRLLSGSTGILPAFTLDRNGRTALHWACASQPPIHSGAIFVSSKQKNLFESNKIASIKILAKSYPQAKIVRDNNNQTPKDIACQQNKDPTLLMAVTPSSKQVDASSGLLLQISRELELGTCDIRLGYKIESSGQPPYHHNDLDDDYWDNSSFYSLSENEKVFIRPESPKSSILSI
jgi:hypothetical protein